MVGEPVLHECEPTVIERKLCNALGMSRCQNCIVFISFKFQNKFSVRFIQESQIELLIIFFTLTAGVVA